MRLQKILPITATSRNAGSTRQVRLALLMVVLLVFAVTVLLNGVDKINVVNDCASIGDLIIFSIFVRVVIKILHVPLFDRVHCDRLL